MVFLGPSPLVKTCYFPMVKSAFHPCTAGRLRTGLVLGAEHLTLGVAQLRAARRAGCRAGGGGWWMVDG